MSLAWSGEYFFCTTAGAISAAVVGACTFIASFRASIVLLTFYWTSSKLTAFCEDRKSADEDFKAGGQRNWIQAKLFFISSKASLLTIEQMYCVCNIRHQSTRTSRHSHDRHA